MSERGKMAGGQQVREPGAADHGEPAQVNAGAPAGANRSLAAAINARETELEQTLSNLAALEAQVRSLELALGDDSGHGTEGTAEIQTLQKLCPICETELENFGHFKSESARPTRRAECPECGSLERHRLVWLYFKNETNLFSSEKKLKMLHIAPESAFKLRLYRSPDHEYVSADLNPGIGDLRMDITDIDMEDETFDVVYCSHVFEHVPEDRQAMRELARVLRKDGWAILLVPILREVTDEDPSVTDPAERTRRFGQFDHVRAYGKDYAQRLEEAGFTVRVDPYGDRLTPEDRERYGLLAGEDIYFCRKAQ